MKWNYRCGRGSCRARTTLTKPLEDCSPAYQKCRQCGGRLHHDPEVSRRHKREKCECDGYHWPHRRGSMWCIHNEDLPDYDKVPRHV